ncbi:hypothetical protein Deba_2800 [Desulfarculus baarsii DSM 2075]|uniref:Uncharacterized protein n=1 Tax=Desulfarculus baarsii (strain ATCC 33931 / DSM 2075 / LMG 7858 / VKM B-1802 / 2st14) TaxID=644282 RepID=E1QMB1_DESB2|nr:hypothetical protein [Desulfarculus baarsii]ADK86154.1 hypothetical protein Deba_2800 [Desulfarculus baarsii DSM 2075]
MEAHAINGLTKVIFEEMASASMHAPDPDALWTPENFGRLRDDLRQRLAPEGRGRAFFEAMFEMSYAEARGLMEQVLAMAAIEPQARPARFATA